jgi:DNA-binding response OmpR family regulator
MSSNLVASGALLFRLDDAVATALGEVLEQLGCAVIREDASQVSRCAAVAARFEAGVVFCAAAGGQYGDLLAALNALPQPPVLVVVSRLPDVPEWLHALDAGAFDYCAAPFEPKQIQWILDSVSFRRSGGPARNPEAVAA